MGHTDVCIIGAGAAGGILALELAQRGRKVVVLDAGPRHDPRDRFSYQEQWLHGINPWATWADAYPEINAYSTGGAVDYPLNSYRVKGVGGSTLAWMAYASRLLPNDLTLRSRHGLAEDWPVSYEALAGYYARAEASLGVAGEYVPGPGRPPSPVHYPHPGFPMSYGDRMIERACARLGIQLGPIPQARLSRAAGSRSACLACGTCNVCPSGAKLSTDLVHIPMAEATGNATVVPGATVSRLELGFGGKVRRAVYFTWDKTEHAQEADVFVNAAGGVEAARLLLLSACKEFPDGLGNRSGRVGTGFSEHPTVETVGRAPDPVFPNRIGFMTSGITQFRDPANRDQTPAIGISCSNGHDSWSLDALLHAHQEVGDELEAELRAELPYLVRLGAMTEQLPQATNTVTLDPQRRDFFGLPVPRISYGLGPYETRGLDTLRRHSRDILEAMGCTHIRHEPVRFAGHHMGTCPMGTSPDRSVVDPDLRCHDVGNLYVVGSSVFPTCGAAGPTLTIAALAIRAAVHLQGGS